MNKTTLLFLASLAVLTTGASAASLSQDDTEVVVLPTYVITSSRYLPVEQQINASLREFTRQAATPVVIAPELNCLKAQATAHNPVAEASRTPLAVRLAKS